MLIRIIERRKYAPSKFLLTLKNFTASYPLKHATRIIALLVSLIDTVFLCVGTINAELNSISHLFDCKYVSINANERTDDILEELNCVDETYRFNFLNQLMSEQNTIVLGFSLSDDATEDFRAIANTLETRGAAIVEFDTVLDSVNKRLISYAELLSYVLMIAFFTTALGIINVLVSSFASRKQERSVYYTVGMSKSDVRKTQIIEVLYLLFISLILTALFTFIPFLVLDAGINSFGIDLFWI